MKAHAAAPARTTGLLAALALLLCLGTATTTLATDRIVLGELWSADG
jgi:hypothetical protein